MGPRRGDDCAVPRSSCDRVISCWRRAPSAVAICASSLREHPAKPRAGLAGDRGTDRDGKAVLLEAALSFLGLGVRPPEPSLGPDARRRKEDIFSAPWAYRHPRHGAVRAGAVDQPGGRRHPRPWLRGCAAVTALLEVDALEVDFPALGHLHPVRDVSFTLDRGETLASSANPVPASHSPRSP